MGYRQGLAPGDLDADGLRKFVQEQLLRIQRATSDMDSTTQEQLTAIDSALTALQSDVATLKIPGEGLAGGGGSSLAVLLDKFTNSLGANVALNNTANYFDGPSVAQGSTGVWFASGKVTLTGASPTEIWGKLWDGTNVADSGSAPIYTAGARITLALSGYFTSPPGNIRISCRDSFSTTSSIEFNRTGNSKDSTVSVVRIG